MSAIFGWGVEDHYYGGHRQVCLCEISSGWPQSAEVFRWCCCSTFVEYPCLIPYVCTQRRTIPNPSECRVSKAWKLTDLAFSCWLTIIHVHVRHYCSGINQLLIVAYDWREHVVRDWDCIIVRILQAAQQLWCSISRPTTHLLLYSLGYFTSFVVLCFPESSTNHNAILWSCVISMKTVRHISNWS
jgi:hypothetical protein